MNAIKLLKNNVDILYTKHKCFEKYKVSHCVQSTVGALDSKYIMDTFSYRSTDMAFEVSTLKTYCLNSNVTVYNNKCNNKLLRCGGEKNINRNVCTL